MEDRYSATRTFGRVFPLLQRACVFHDTAVSMDPMSSGAVRHPSLLDLARPSDSSHTIGYVYNRFPPGSETGCGLLWMFLAELANREEQRKSQVLG